MQELITVTNDAEHERAMARLNGLMNNCANDAEVAELRALAQAIQDYELEHSWLSQVETDGVHEIEFMLDQGAISLDDLVSLLGGIEAVAEYMTRRQNLEAEVIDAIVANFDTKREWIDKPFCEPEGWKGITMEDSTCCDEDPCPMGIGEWRERLLAERARMEAAEARHERVGAGRPVQDVGAMAAD